MANISIDLTENPNGWEARVEIEEGASTTTHTVDVENSYYERLSSNGKYTPEQVIETSFEFLLAREPKESILSRFDLPVISRYFNDYEKKLSGMLKNKYT